MALAGGGIAMLAVLLAAVWFGRRQRVLLLQLQELRLQENTRGHQLEQMQGECERLQLELDDARDWMHQQRGLAQQQLERLHGAEKQLEAVRARDRLQHSQLEQLQQQLQKERQVSQGLAAEQAALQTGLQAKEEHFSQQLQQLNDNRQLLAREFENLANRIFQEKGESFTRSSQAGIDSLLKPFREQIEAFQKRVNEVHDASVQGNVSLKAEVHKVLEAGLQMSSDANSLVSALKGDAQQRGAWGEAQLQRTLEMGGLVAGEHYEVQRSFRDGQGRLKQTDYLIRLPDGKHIVIDSKVTLNAYQRLVEAETPEQEQQALQEHVRAVRRHIEDLASKDYSSLPGLDSPNFVLMFMPVEPAFIEALRQDRELFEYGYRKNVVLVSHTTLIPVLRTVANLWMAEHSRQEIREISDRAGDIYNQVCVVAERLARLGNTLGAAGNHYNAVVTSLAGQQGLHGKVERFARLSNRANKQMPELELHHPDLATERLQPAARGLNVQQENEVNG